MKNMVRMSGRLQQSLELKIPSLFQCPISLELMHSPVSLYTGVTYDRSSIQPWLDSGHTTCPTTMLPLSSTDLIPNHTLRRLIHLWSSSLPADLLTSLNSPNPVPTILKIADLLCDPILDVSFKNNLVCSSSSIIVSNISTNSDTQAVEAAVRTLALIFTMDCIEESIKRMTSAALTSTIQQSLSSIMNVMSNGSTLDSRVDAARVLYVLIQESRIIVADTPGLVSEVIGFINNGGEAAETGITCLIRMSEAGRRVIIQMVKAGLVPAIMQVLTAEEPGEGAIRLLEGAIRLLEEAMDCAEGRAAICEVAEACVTAMVGRMMKVGREGQEAAVGVLWGLCCVVRDSRARSAVAGASGGLAKILLLMQGECSPAARRMSGDLLRVFRLDRKSCLTAYDTKTTHIMPF